MFFHLSGPLTEMVRRFEKPHFLSYLPVCVCVCHIQNKPHTHGCDYSTTSFCLLIDMCLDVEILKYIIYFYKMLLLLISQLYFRYGKRLNF